MVIKVLNSKLGITLRFYYFSFFLKKESDRVPKDRLIALITVSPSLVAETLSWLLFYRLPTQNIIIYCFNFRSWAWGSSWWSPKSSQINCFTNTFL